jgi:hypothetical protein
MLKKLRIAYLRFKKKYFPKYLHSRKILLNSLELTNKESILVKNELFKLKNPFLFKEGDIVKWCFMPQKKYIIFDKKYKLEPWTNKILDIDYLLVCIDNDAYDKKSYWASQYAITLFSQLPQV